MQKKLRIAGILTIIGILTVVITYIYVNNKPHTDYQASEADFIVDARQLFEDYKYNTDTANARYTGKVVQLSGKIDNVEILDSVKIAVFVFEEGDFGDEGVRCTFIKNYDPDSKGFDLNNSVSIKGHCTGYNDTDVILEECSIVN